MGMIETSAALAASSWSFEYIPYILGVHTPGDLT
jgi:hypothetical protein